MPLTTLNFSSASSFPTGSIVKAETKVITAFGDTTVASTSSYNDITGTEQTFTRTFADSNILSLWNLKLSSYLNVF